MDARSISELISDEHPQIIALIVSYLDAGLGLTCLDCCQKTTSQRSSEELTLQTVGPDALRELEQVMQRKFKANTSLRASQVGGVDAAARIMNYQPEYGKPYLVKDIAKAINP